MWSNATTKLAELDKQTLITAVAAGVAGGVVLTVCAQYLFTKKEKGGEGGTGGDGGETDGHGSNSSEVPADPNDIDGWMALAHSERLKRTDR
eukprot:gene14263-27686_t